MAGSMCCNTLCVLMLCVLVVESRVRITGIPDDRDLETDEHGNNVPFEAVFQGEYTFKLILVSNTLLYIISFEFISVTITSNFKSQHGGLCWMNPT